MALFKVGDRVLVPLWANETNREATVCEVSIYSIGVSYDVYSAHRHDCAGSCQMGYGWYFNGRDLDLIEATFITKQELICKKIKYLQDKFNNRKDTRKVDEDEPVAISGC
jgi:hypothetical protein